MKEKDSQKIVIEKTVTEKTVIEKNSSNQRLCP